MKEMIIVLSILVFSLPAWFLGAPRAALAAEKAVQITVPDCRA